MKNKIHGSGIIFENNDGQILVLKRTSGGLEGSTWGLVGGTIDEGEDSISAVIREVQEEIGYKLLLENVKFIKSYNWDRQGYELIFDLYKFLGSADEVVIELNIDEHIEFDWISPDKLANKDNLMEGLYIIISEFYS